MNIILWVIQIIVALLFLMAGVMKFMMPAEEMAKNMPPGMSVNFIYFIGVCEVLGGIGLVVPWATKIMPKLTPIAAVGLLIIMIGAVVITVPMGIGNAVIPAVAGLLCAFVAFGRFRPTT
jgi:uncharacterized membrane protein YphA (DoxX/SURF4 family)